MISREQLDMIRGLVEQNGYLPYSNKGLRLFDALANVPGEHQATLQSLRSQFQDAGYLPYSRAMELIRLVSTQSIAS
ncbi:hypothetical protein [Tuwongella immobilis]|uniref:Uncharacterized protein n=1 Tax=Tuwongella immobilis TaxID=692036 RepID=A0A6C2YQ59_9BACT|nr:hypothetical protein [Tuwongella immobilis]VIP03155.1 unnamed protein product [Tuwongella immobilis]VTS03552.1 unnamed protein product [Tuwongella immobilis]